MKGKFRLMWRVGLALVLALSLSLVMAVPVSAAALTGVSATPVDATEKVATTYTIGFTTVTTCDVKMVDIAFDTGFTGTAVLVEATGIGTGTLTGVALPDITYGVTAPAVIPAGTAITITFSGVVNPAAGDYSPAVTVTTKSIAEAPIDTGTADVTITPLPASFEVVAGANNIVTAGEAFSVIITAKDEAAGAGDIETGYIGDHFISFTSTASDPKTIPAFELISFTDGVGTSLQNFILTKVETGKTITATDEAFEPEVTGESEEITINLPALHHFVITDAPASVTAGVAFTTDVVVTAYDAEDNVKTDYTGTVSWTSSDPSAELPDAHALVLGTHTFLKADFTLKTVGEGTQTITVTGDGVSTSSAITVTPAAASELTIKAEPTSIRADGTDKSKITATAYDEFGNVDTNYSEVVTFETSLGTLSADGSFAAGVASRDLTSTDVGTATIKVTSGTLPYATTTVNLMKLAAVSTYAFDYEVPVSIMVGDNVPVPVTFATAVLGDAGYAAVRFSFAAVGPEDSVVTFTATDSLGNTIIQTNSGVWGPASGFLLPADYDEYTDWTVSFSAAGRYTITFNCYEIGYENTPFATGSQVVTVPRIGSSTDIGLFEGWNLISLPLIPFDSSIETVLAGVTVDSVCVAVDSVWAYDAAIEDPDARWSSYVPGAPGDLETMVAGKGYWVEMSEVATLTIIGKELPDPPATPPTYDVVVGWNLIGFTSLEEQLGGFYLGPAVSKTVEVMYRYNAISGLYELVVVIDPDIFFEDLTQFEALLSIFEVYPCLLFAGEGYWLAVNEAGTIYPSTPDVEIPVPEP